MKTGNVFSDIEHDSQRPRGRGAVRGDRGSDGTVGRDVDPEPLGVSFQMLIPRSLPAAATYRPSRDTVTCQM